MKVLLFAWLLLGVSAAQAQRIPLFPVTPEVEAVAEAHQVSAVIRLHERTVRVESPRRATTTTRFVVTLFGPSTQDLGEHYAWYDSFRRIRRFEGRLVDARGQVIRRLGRGDIEDFPATSRISLYDDNRVKRATLRHSTYPYTLEFETEIEHQGFLNLTTFYPQEQEIPVLEALLTVHAPAGLPLRHRTFHLDVTPQHTTDGDTQTLTWRMAEMPVTPHEAYGPSWHAQRPRIEVVSDQFELAGHPGSMASWDDFGRWAHTLWTGRGQLPAAALADVRDVVATATTDRERVQRLYAYVQQRSRYVSVQLGIGGWQPFDATYVYERRYGDCKALVNFMQALLHAVGLPSYPVLVQAGDDAEAVDPTFPAQAFNHVILLVPLADGDVWLECTSQASPFGFLGSFTEGRWGLILRAEGSDLVRIPQSAPDDNRHAFGATVHLQSDGSAQVAWEARYAGEQQALLTYALSGQTTTDQQKALLDHLNIPNLTLTSATFDDVAARRNVLQLAASFTVPRYGTRTGTRLLVAPNLFRRSSTGLPAMPERRQPLVFGHAFTTSDTLRYIPPATYEVERLPPPVALTTPFAAYEAQVEALPDGALRYTRRLTWHATRLPPEDYDAVRDFFTAVARADGQQVILRTR